MAKKQADPDQLALPGVETDPQSKLDFAKPGGKTPKPKKTSGKAGGDDEHLPPNLAKPVKVRVPDFSNPKRPKTCLEVDFPLVPINALSALEGNAGKPIYQMSKWWARRRSCVFRAMLIAAATEAPLRKNPDGSPVLDAEGQPIPDDTEKVVEIAGDLMTPMDIYPERYRVEGFPTAEQLAAMGNELKES